MRSLWQIVSRNSGMYYCKPIYHRIVVIVIIVVSISSFVTGLLLWYGVPSNEMPLYMALYIILHALAAGTM